MLPNKNRALLLCLDKSGSMCGNPWASVQQAAILVSQIFGECNAFQYMGAVVYDMRITYVERREERQF